MSIFVYFVANFYGYEATCSSSVDTRQGVVTLGVASLYHEALDDPVEQMAVVVAIATVHAEVLNSFRTPTKHTRNFI